MRHNPQLGGHEHTSTIIISTISGAEQLAKKRCESMSYGYNCFQQVAPSSKKLLQYKKDYNLFAETNRKTGSVKILAKKIR